MAEPSKALLVLGLDEHDIKDAFETGDFKRPHDVEGRHLEIGDAMIVSSEAETKRLGYEQIYWIFERKSLCKNKGAFEASDLAASIKDGRLRNQTARMKAHRGSEQCRLMVILEGPMQSLKDEDAWVAGLKVSVIRDKIAELQVKHHIYVANTVSLHDTARFLQEMAWEVSDSGHGIYEPPLLEDAHKYMSVKKSDALTPLNGFRLALETGVKGLGKTRATAIADYFKTPSALTVAYQLCTSEYERMRLVTKIKDVGPKTSKSLYQFWYGADYDDENETTSKKPPKKKSRQAEEVAAPAVDFETIKLSMVDEDSSEEDDDFTFVTEVMK